MGVVCGGFDGSDGGRKLERAEEGQTIWAAPLRGAPCPAAPVGRDGAVAPEARPRGWLGPLGPAAGMAWCGGRRRRPPRSGVAVAAALSAGRRRNGADGDGVLLWGRAGGRTALGRCPFPVVPDRPWGRRRWGPGMVPGAWGPGAGVRPWPPEAAPDGCPALFRGSAGLIVGDAGEFGLGVGVAFLVGAYPFVAVVGGVQFVPLVGVWVVP